MGREGLVKGSSDITGRGEMPEQLPSPSTSGELIPRGRDSPSANSELWNKVQKNHVWGKVLQTAKINGLEIGLIRTWSLPHDIIVFSANSWIHTTSKFCIRIGVVPSLLRTIKQKSLPMLSSGSFLAVVHGAGWMHLHACGYTLVKIVVALQVTVVSSWVTVRRTSLRLNYLRLFPRHSAGVNISAVEAECLFGFCSGVAACAVWRSSCYCQRKIKTNLAWLIKGYEY